MSDVARLPAREADPSGDLSLPGWVYRDPEYFGVEMRRLIRPAWQIVCHVSDIAEPGDWRTLDYLGESVIVIRGADGAVRAFANVCRHRGSRLLDGQEGCARRLTCPYHGWTYGADGRLIGVPHKADYAGLDPADWGLVPIELEQWRGFLFVRLGPPRDGEVAARRADGGAGAGAAPSTAFGDGQGRLAPRAEAMSGGHGALSIPPRSGEEWPSVAEMMAPYDHEVAPHRFEELKALGRITMRPRDVNWKNVADNYSDGLHINVAHPGLTRLFGTGYGIEAEAHVDRMYGDLLERPSTNLSERAYQALLPAEAGRRWLYFKLWPNVAFDIYPDQVDFMHFVPVGPTETLIREISYAVPDDRREMKAARYLNWRINRRVNDEDTALIRRVQQGMESSFYTPGPLGRSEVCLRSFARKLRRLIPETRLESPPERWAS